MAQSFQYHRPALSELIRGPWQTLWIATPQLQAEALRPFLPHLSRAGVQVRILTDLSHEALVDGRVELRALEHLRVLPNCEIRGLPDLNACLYAAEHGPALVSGAPLTLEGLDGTRNYGVSLAESDGVVADLQAWWEAAHQLAPQEWEALTLRIGQRQTAQRVGAEIARLGAFVRVSVWGTRRSRRLDPREFGARVGDFGPAIRPVEVLLYKLDEVVRAKDELEALLAAEGLEWNGQYLLPRRFLEQEWPALFQERQRQLEATLYAAESQAALREQLAQARSGVEAFFRSIFDQVVEEGMEADAWVEMQTTRLLSEYSPEAILADCGLEYRVLTILPEDRRSTEELDLLLRDPKLRSVQLTFPL